jgi:hypothetical protein
MLLNEEHNIVITELAEDIVFRTQVMGREI